MLTPPTCLCITPPTCLVLAPSGSHHALHATLAFNQLGESVNQGRGPGQASVGRIIEYSKVRSRVLLGPGMTILQREPDRGITTLPTLISAVSGAVRLRKRVNASLLAVLWAGTPKVLTLIRIKPGSSQVHLHSAG
jgi:hypothetical protein